MFLSKIFVCLGLLVLTVSYSFATKTVPIANARPSASRTSQASSPSSSSSSSTVFAARKLQRSMANIEFTPNKNAKTPFISRYLQRSQRVMQRIVPSATFLKNGAIAAAAVGGAIEISKIFTPEGEITTTIASTTTTAKAATKALCPHDKPYLTKVSFSNCSSINTTTQSKKKSTSPTRRIRMGPTSTTTTTTTATTRRTTTKIPEIQIPIGQSRRNCK